MERNYNNEFDRQTGKQWFYNNKILAVATGIATSNATGPYCAAPLHPSVSQVSQNSVFMYDGVLLFMQSSFGAFILSQKHDREMTYLSFTVKWEEKLKEKTNKYNEWTE